MTPFTDQRRLFTPRVSRTSDDRYRMRLSPDDAAKIGRGRRWNAEVTDLETGRRYSVQGAKCGADCFCDAIVTYEHPLPDKILVERSKERAVRVIILDEDYDTPGHFQVKDIIEWDEGRDLVEQTAHAAARHIVERCGDQFTLMAPEGFSFPKRVTRLETMIGVLIKNLKDAA